MDMLLQLILKKLRKKVILLLSFFSGLSLYASEGKPKKSSNLARIAVIDFLDHTGSKNFGYLSKSISDAVNLYLKKRFEYKRVSPDKADSILVKKYKVRKVKNIKELTQDTIIKLADDLGANVIIYGRYSYNENTHELEIYTSIYLKFAFRFIRMNTFKTSISVELFKVTQQLAREINSQIAEAFSLKAEQDISRKQKEALSLDIASYHELGLLFGPFYPIDIITSGDDLELPDSEIGLAAEIYYTYILASLLPAFFEARSKGYFPDLHIRFAFNNFIREESTNNAYSASIGGIFSFNLPGKTNHALKFAFLIGGSYNSIKNRNFSFTGFNPDLYLLFGYQVFWDQFALSVWFNGNLRLGKDYLLFLPSISLGTGYRF